MWGIVRVVATFSLQRSVVLLLWCIALWRTVMCSCGGGCGCS